MVQAQQLDSPQTGKHFDEAIPQQDEHRSRSLIAGSSRLSSTFSLTVGHLSVILLFKRNYGHLVFQTSTKVPRVSLLVKLLKYTRPTWRQFCLGFVGNLMSGIALPVNAVFFSQLLVVYSLNGKALLTGGVICALIFFGLGLIRAFGFYISAFYLGRCGENLTSILRLRCFKQLLRMHTWFFDSPENNTGELCTRLTTDGPNLRYTFTRLPSVLASLIALVVAVALAFLFCWQLAILLLVMMPLVAGCVFLTFYTENARCYMDKHLMNEAGKIVSETVSNIRTVKIFASEQYFSDKYNQSILDPYTKNMKFTLIFALSYAFAESVQFIFYYAGFLFGGHLISMYKLSPLNLFRAFIPISYTQHSTFGDLTYFISDVVKARVSAERIFGMIEARSDLDQTATHGRKTAIDGDITFKNVRFAYPIGKRLPVLNDVSLRIKKGSSLALVGSSGCGKSTLIKLIERFYDPQHGAIMIDNENIKSFNVGHLRRQIGLVSQEPVLFSCSILENLVFGLDYPVEHDQIVRAARQANIHEFISSLPKGYDTLVGEKGLQISGGQKQRIAIARALISDPKILLLDEATSALLDTQSEQVVQAALDSARKGRTCIMVAHRLSTIQNADCIAFMTDGKITEKGTHDELLALQQQYYSMCKEQTHFQ